MRAEVVVNGRFLHRKITGVERYAHEVTQRLGDKIKFVGPKHELHGFAGHLWEQLALPKSLNGDTILWSPANTGPLSVNRQIVTIHDCSPIDHPEWFRKSFEIWYRFLLLKLVHRVAQVITHSEFSRQRILELCHGSEDRVVTIPPGVDRKHFNVRSANEVERVLEKYGIPRDYILVVGSIDPRKNFQSLFRAWNIFYRDNEMFNLVIAGSRGRAFREVRVNVHHEGVKFLGYIEENELPPLYSGAVACINPSLYEGFGLTVLEAMACGSPVIASRNTAMPEVVGDAGILINPLDIDEIATAMETLISDTSARNDLIQKGLERANNFNWEETANQVWSTIQLVRDRA